MEDIVNRIDEVRNTNGLSQSEFADHCKIKRSILSHIMSGRNKPSLSVIQQVLDGFPNVSSDWLLMGKGEREYVVRSENPGSTLEEKKKHKQSQEPPPSLFGSVGKNENSMSNSNSEKAPSLSKDKYEKDSKILKIICFYRDGSFTEHNFR